eukprot:6201061-Pleurochrysis_carterae.AAC.2
MDPVSLFLPLQNWTGEASAEVRSISTLSKARNSARDPPPALREARALQKREDNKRKRLEKREQELKDEAERLEKKKRKDEADAKAAAETLAAKAAATAAAATAAAAAAAAAAEEKKLKDNSNPSLWDSTDFDDQFDNW